MVSSAGRFDKKSSQYPVTNQFEHLSVKNGLSDNSVKCILQDREGFLWFGTANGLNKYDGRTFTVLQQDPSSPDSSLQSNVISALYEDRSGKLWATTMSSSTTEGGGLHQINKRTCTATPVRLRVPSVDWKRTLGIYEDRRGVLWIGSWGGLIRYAPQSGQYALYPSPEKNAPVICAHEDAQNQFWVGTINGLYRFDRQSGAFTLVRFPADRQPWVSTLFQDKSGTLWAGTNAHGLMQIKSDGKSSTFVQYVAKESIHTHIFSNAIHEGQTGYLWLGTVDGLQQLDTRTGAVATYRANPALPSALSNNQVRAVYQDPAGTLWLGTDQGINKQVRASTKFSSVRLVQAPPELPSAENYVSAVVQDRNGIIWIGSNNKKLYRYNPGTGDVAFIPIDPDNPDNPSRPNQFQAIYQDRSGQLWASTESALLRMDRVTGTFVQYKPRLGRILAFAEDSTGLLWVGGEGGIAQFNPESSQFGRYYLNNHKAPVLITCFIVSRTGTIWMGVEGKGVCRLDPKTGRLTQYYPVLPAADGQLNDTEITNLFEDANGLVWIGTNAGGLNWFDPATNRFSALTTRHGLPANHISAIINDRHGDLWISTSRGICRLNTKTKTVNTYSTDDGLPHNTFLNKVSYGLNGDLLFGSLNGVAIVHTDRITKKAAFPVYVTRFSVFDKKRLLPASQIQLRHDENFISFEFAGLDYASPEKNQYAYQLVGVDENWVQNGYAHTANYTNLSPGTYIFQVRAANRDGIWSNNRASIQLIIRPPWWATWWAYGLYALLAGGVVWGSLRLYTNRIQQQQELELNRREAEQLKAVDELKNRFFSNITHELRTPLSLIISPVEKLLQESRFDRPMLALVHHNAEKLLRLINQLLDLSKLEGNYMAITPMRGNVSDFIQQVVEVFRRSAEQNGVTLTCIVTDLPPQELVFDADKWEKILTNLLSNALKFTPTGGQVTVSSAPVWSGNELTGMQLQIADSGIGIAPEQLSHIFDRFFQADTSSTRAYGGTGIGLALVNELVGLLKGTITVESQTDVGTTFTLTLPVQPISAAVNAPPINWSALVRPAIDGLSSPEPASVARTLGAEQPMPRILIVEDNDELREFLVAELMPSYQVLQAVDGQEGWAVTQTELPDIVLTDVMMPHVDGYELTRLIKGHVDTDHIAVVMLTAKAAQPSRIEGLQQGADDYLSKPFSVNELHLRLRNLIIRQQKIGEYYRQQFTLPTDRPAPDALPSIPVAPPDPFLLRIYELLEKHLDDSSINVDWLADQLDLNRKTLYRKVQSLIQLTPAGLIRQYRLRKAADLLQEGNNVAETAYKVGFSTPSHFTTVFKETYGQTPTQFIGNRLKNA